MTLKDFNNQQNLCPACGSDDLEDDRIIHPVFNRQVEGINDHIYFECACKQCGCKFKQLFDLRYAGWVIQEPGVVI